jgi:hypothetical protein
MALFRPAMILIYGGYLCRDGTSDGFDARVYYWLA